MMLKPKLQFARWQKELLFIFVITVLTTSLVAPLDIEWTQKLGVFSKAPFPTFMHQSLFEKGKFGGSDPGTLFVVFAALLWLLSYKRNASRFLISARPSAIYITLCGMVTTLLVHGLKLTIGRARPLLVLTPDSTIAYTPWYKFGSHHIADGIFVGAMPSGHVATVAIFFAAAYVSLFYSRHTQKQTVALSNPITTQQTTQSPTLWSQLLRSQKTTRILFISTFVYSGLMIVARTMSLQHWLSESVFALGMVLAVCHTCYRTILPQLEKDGKLSGSIRFSLKRGVGIYILCLTLTIVFRWFIGAYDPQRPYKNTEEQDRRILWHTAILTTHSQPFCLVACIADDKYLINSDCLSPLIPTTDYEIYHRTLTAHSQNLRIVSAEPFPQFPNATLLHVQSNPEQRCLPTPIEKPIALAEVRCVNFNTLHQKYEGYSLFPISNRVFQKENSNNILPQGSFGNLFQKGICYQFGNLVGI